MKTRKNSRWKKIHHSKHFQQFIIVVIVLATLSAIVRVHCYRWKSANFSFSLLSFFAWICRQLSSKWNVISRIFLQMLNKFFHHSFECARARAKCCNWINGLFQYLFSSRSAVLYTYSHHFMRKYHLVYIIRIYVHKIRATEICLLVCYSSSLL